MANENDRIQADRQRILDAQKRGGGAKLWTYTRLSGPGWLQGAITLGGGSLAGSLYLGVIGGYQMLWLQPLMMVLGIIMLSVIAYVALSTGEKPFRGINRHVNPVLGWGWVIATLMANLVWAMPQFSLGVAALEQNLLPGVANKYVATGVLFVVAASVIWFYDSGGWGIKLFEVVLKVMVGVVVVSFFGVVASMALSEEGLPWGEILAGFVPDFSLLSQPAEALRSILGEVGAKEFWTERVLSTQRDRMVTAAATAVGINMTFLLPYSMLRRGWDRDFRGLAVFDLSIGLFFPFVLATSCVMIAAGSQFHGRYEPALIGEAPMTETVKPLVGSYTSALDDCALAALDAVERARVDELPAEERAAWLERAREALPTADKRLAAMLVSRDANQLAGALEHLTGKVVAQYVFGVGVLGMAVSTIIILMLINGFTICEMLDVPSKGAVHRLGSFLPGISGALGFLFLWGDGAARFWLAVPTSVFGMVLLPIAYVTFFLMMNNRALLGDALPRGGKRVAINVAMLVALAAASVGAAWSIWGRKQPIPGLGGLEVRWVAIGIVAAFVGLAVIVHFARGSRDGRA